MQISKTVKYDEKKWQRVKQIFNYYESNVRPKWIKDYQSYAWDMSPRKQYIDTTWQSNISSWITKKTIKTFFAHIYDNLIKFYVWWASEAQEDKEKADLVEQYLIRTYSVSKTKRYLHTQILDALIIGEWYGKVGFSTRQKEKKYIVPKYDEKWNIISGEMKTKKIFKQNGTYEYISPFELLNDPAGKDPYNTTMKIRRILLPQQKLKDKYGMFFSLNDKDVEEIIRNPHEFSSKDRTFQRNQILVQDWITDISSYNSTYAFEKSKYVEVVEVWLDDDKDWKLEIYVNGYTAYDNINPYPLEEDPFTYLFFSLEWGTIRGTWLASLLRPYDDMASAFLNAYIDDLKIKSNPVLLKVAGKSQIYSTDNEVSSFFPGKIITVEDVNQLQPLELWNANIQVIDLVNFLENAAFMAAGINEIVMGSPLAWSKIPRVAGDVTNRVQWFKVRMLSLFDSLNDVMSKVGKFWTGLGNIYMKPGTIMKIFNDEEKAWTWWKINPEDLDWEFDIIFDTEALKTAYKEIRIAQLTQFLSVVGNNAIDPSTGMPVINFSDMIRQLAQYLDLKSTFIYSDKEAVKKLEKAELDKLDIQKKVQKKTMKIQQELAESQQPQQIPWQEAAGADIATIIQNLAKQWVSWAPTEELPQEPEVVAPENMEANAIENILTPPQ